MARRKRKKKEVNLGTSKRAVSVPVGTKSVSVKNAEVEVEGSSARLTRRKRGGRRAGEHGGVEGSPLKALPPTLMDMEYGGHTSQGDFLKDVSGIVNKFPKTLFD